MTKDELENYARDNRDRLQAQEVKLGDEVKMLKGQFAGETGVVVGLQAFREDISDPYYEVDMNCEVPDKYKCRKTLLTPNNVIGGVSANEFEVMPKKQSAGAITIPVKADFGEDMGFTLLDRALELQKKYTKLKDEIVRLYDVVLARQLNEFTVYAPFNNRHLNLIIETLNNFRPLTAEEKLQEFIDNALKKQSE